MRAIIFSLAILAASACKKDAPAPAPTPTPVTGSGSGSAPATSDAAAIGSGSGLAVVATGSGSGSAEAPPAPYTPAADVAQPIKDAIAAADRTVNDRRLDAGRKPGEVLSFFAIAPGQNIGELFSGGGYTTELIARTVGDAGKVWGENPKDIMDKFARKPWTERAAKPVMKNVTMLETPIDAPFGADVKNLDAVITILNYHDTVNMKADRAKMNKAVFAALKPGGVYGIVDSSAADGSGTRDTDTLHRIDEAVVKKEVAAAGFKLDGESDVLRNKDDKRDWNSSPRAAGDKRGTSDRFVLKFVKPKKK